jgi:hypothetical protein
MPEGRKDLGKLVGIYGASAASLQRAAIVAIVSLAFFLAMLAIFYVRQQLGYFMLSSAFLALYVITMIGIWMQKRNTVKIYENGFSYKKFTAAWSEISRVEADRRSGIAVTKTKGDTVIISPSITGQNEIALAFRDHLKK